MHTHVHVPDVTFAAMPAEARANAVREAWRIVVFHKLEQSPFDAICRDSLALECVCVCVCVCVCERERERERERDTERERERERERESTSNRYENV